MAAILTVETSSQMARILEIPWPFEPIFYYNSSTEDFVLSVAIPSRNLRIDVVTSTVISGPSFRSDHPNAIRVRSLS